MGKCLSCCKENQSFQPKYAADQVTSDPQHHGASSVTQSTKSLDFKAVHPTSKYRGTRESKNFSSPSDTSSCSSFFRRRHCLFAKFQKSSTSLHSGQSRANFDFQEKGSLRDLKSPLAHFSLDGSLFSAPKLNVISCYESVSTFFDTQSGSQYILHPNEIEIISKSSCITDAEKYMNSSSPEYNTKHFMNSETKIYSLAHRNTVASIYQSTETVLTLPTIISYSSQQHEIASDIQEKDQLRKNLFHPGFQSYSRNNSPAMVQQPPAQSVTSFILHNTGFTLFYKNASSFTPSQNEVTSYPFEDENNAISSKDEDRSSPNEIPKIRYVTANTDTEEQSFPSRKAFNTRVEELNLDALIQMADNLRMSESSKMESFELLCDHKEKFRDEIEFIWRFARAYGDMYELSTNAQEKKHYANIGKTLGEKAITRAPMNGYCHLWYAVLCGYVSEFEGLQNKINYGYRFKEHLDKAIEFLPEEPFLYYLKGRYCYTVSKLSWIEKKMAATLFGKIPSSTVQEALQNFLKVEELHPGFSKSNYMFLAKCYIDLEQTDDAVKFCNLAVLLPCVTKEELK
uniref:Regulator of microtubule dynamics protein 2 n=2 Tax=Catagonus wagneri TaxID=51154 RepID=A0A8C3X3K1_9CETA